MPVITQAKQLLIYDKDTTPIAVQFKQGGVGYDITGMTVLGIVSSEENSGHLVVKTVTSHTTPASGITSITLDQTDITTIGGVGVYWITIKLVNAALEELTICKLKLIIAEVIASAAP